MNAFDHSPPYRPSLDLSSCPASESVTPDAHAQACADMYSDLRLRVVDVERDGLHGARTFGAKMDATFRCT